MIDLSLRIKPASYHFREALLESGEIEMVKASKELTSRRKYGVR